MSCKLNTIIEADSVNGEVDLVPYAYGGKVPLTFKNISYAGTKPTDTSGRSFQLLIKKDRAEDDSLALVDATNIDLTISIDPLKIQYSVDTSAVGFLPSQTLYGELWVTDTVVGRQLVWEFQIQLSDPIKNTFP